MIMQKDKMSAPSSRERAQQLHDKILELENKRRRSAQARVPSDPNAWQQIRENYEAIILEDYGFSEQHNIEYALWQLHYRRIEELRAHYNTALASASNPSQTAKGPSRPDRITKIRLQFKTFLTEASGFYHDLIVKIRAKYGLLLGHFSETPENQNGMEKDGKKSAEVKKGLISCHRCLIYLGDLVRYKGLYGDGDSKTREFQAASSYYLQAASLFPSSGNPHHQLAIIASYSGDELAAVYRYFRSLAVDSPFLTARENLVVAFEKNRNSYSQLPGEAPLVKDSTARLTGKARGKGEAKVVSKDINNEASFVKEDSYKEFCIRFVRLNGILFTRTSLETFGEVLSLVSSGLFKLLYSGQEEEPTFGADASESGLIIIRLVAILVYTVHNVNRESEGTYAEVLQRKAVLKNAYIAVFELMGHIIEKCVKLCDPCSSFFLPGILIFVEWLACCPEVSAGSNVDDEKQAVVRSKFWSFFIAFLNKLLSAGSVSMGADEDESCFNNMSSYDEENTENRLALNEDFELRGFLPLAPAHSFLDFSRKRSFGSDSQKENKIRIERILAAGKILASLVKVDHKAVRYDSRAKKFVVLDETSVYSAISSNVDTAQETQAAEKPSLEDNDDEVIVFKPLVVEKRPEMPTLNWSTYEESVSKPIQKVSASDVTYSSAAFSSLHEHVCHQTSMAPSSNNNAQPFVSKWMKEEAYLANGVGNMSLMGNGNEVKTDHQGINPVSVHVPVHTRVPFQQSVNEGLGGMRHMGNGHEVKTDLQRVNPVSFHAPVPLQQSINESFGGMRLTGNGHEMKTNLQGVNPVTFHTPVPFQQSVNESFGGTRLMGNGHEVQANLQKDSAVSFPIPVQFQQSVNEGLGNMRFPGNGHEVKSDLQKGNPVFFNVPVSFQQSLNVPTYNNHTKAPETSFPSMSDGTSQSIKTSLSMSAGLRRAPVGRPTRHLGPPPGFSQMPTKQVNEGNSGAYVAGESQIVDDYSWLDGYNQMPPSWSTSSGFPSNSHPFPDTNTIELPGNINFPFPGKQLPKGWQDYPVRDSLKQMHEQQIQQQQQLNGNHVNQVADQYQAQSGLAGRYFV